MFLQTILANTIATVIGEAVGQIARDPKTPIDAKDAPQIAAEVAPVVIDKIQQDPRVKEITDRIEHLTSSEKWYQSRANWSAVVSGLTPMVAILGYNLSPEDQITVAGICVALGNLLALYLARRARTAKKPLGVK